MRSLHPVINLYIISLECGTTDWSYTLIWYVGVCASPDAVKAGTYTTVSNRYVNE